MRLDEINNPPPSYRFTNKTFSSLKELNLEDRCTRLQLLRCRNVVNLEGSPRIVEHNVVITTCASLESLEGCCKEVGKIFTITNNNNLVSLRGIGECVIKGSFTCWGNEKLVNLDEVPRRVEGTFTLNESIKDVSNIRKMEYCSRIKISSLDHLERGLYDMLRVNGLQVIEVTDNPDIAMAINKFLPLHDMNVSKWFKVTKELDKLGLDDIR